MTGRVLFAEEANHDMLEHLLEAGAEVKATRLAEEFDFEASTQG